MRILDCGYLSIAAAALTMAGCASSGTHSTSPSITVRELSEQGHCHEAYLLWPKVVEELATTGEDALGYEYSRLESCTARNGRDQWDDILADPRIPLEMKLSLITAIQDELCNPNDPTPTP